MTSYRADKQVIDTHTDTGNDNTRRPKLASGKKKEIPVEKAHLYFKTIQMGAICFAHRIQDSY